MNKIREERKFEFFFINKVSIIDVCLALISTPTRGVVIRKKYFGQSFLIITPTPTRGVVIRTEHTSVIKLILQKKSIWL